MTVTVLRIGHRPERDKRITTHVALTARAFGADRIIITTKDQGIEDGVCDVVKRFGGDFHAETGIGWRGVLQGWKGKVVHLTMYGIPISEAMEDIPRDEPLLVVVGAEKVPAEIYQRADFNVSVGSQPHSEVAALAVFLDRFFGGEALSRETMGEMQIVPCERGKQVLKRGRIPGREECISLLEKAGCSPSVIEHAVAVERLASVMVSFCPDADAKLVSAGALLHDIGRGKTHDIMHCVEGALFIRNQGLDDGLARIVQRHVGAGLDEDERERLGLPPGCYIPETMEEKMVSHADNLVSDASCRPLTEILEKLERKGLDKASRRVVELHQELEDAMGVDLQRLCRENLG